MTDLQKTFLLCTLVYFLIKGALYVGLYVALIMVEKEARIRWDKFRVYLAAKRKDEEERWSTAYRLLQERAAQRMLAAQSEDDSKSKPGLEYGIKEDIGLVCLYDGYNQVWTMGNGGI